MVYLVNFSKNFVIEILRTKHILVKPVGNLSKLSKAGHAKILFFKVVLFSISFVYAKLKVLA